MSRLVPATHLALSSLLHDLGKLAERAGLPHHGRLDAHKNLYCPWHPIGKDDGKGQGKGWHSHVHAAYTGLAWDALEASGHFPNLRRDAPPFQPASGGQTPDSAVNAASAHHCPQTFLQWIVATADRVASGFERQEFDEKYNNRRERDNHYRARLLTLFEQCHLEHIEEGRLDWRYLLRILSPESIYPRHQRDCTPCDDATARAESLALWQALLDGLQHIPQAHLANLPLWLDHFDSLWLTVCHSIPSATAHGVKPDVSLYDHGKTTAALAVALWRWHEAHADFAVTSLRGKAGAQKKSCSCRAIFSASRISSSPKAVKRRNRRTNCCAAVRSRFCCLPSARHSNCSKRSNCRRPRKSSIAPANSSSSRRIPPTRTYGELARRGVLRRAWDFDTTDADGTLWRGYAPK